MSELHQEIYGQGEPVVMLHGWAMHTGIWREFAQALAVCRQVICLDLPGHGLSKNISPYTLESVVDAVSAQLPGQASVLVGWSLGGNVALRLAEKYPQRVKAVVLIASNPHFVQTESWPGMPAQLLQEFAANIQKNARQTLLRFMSLQVQDRADVRASLKQIKRAMQECAAPDPEILLAALQVLQTVDQREMLRSLNLPVLMVFAGQDSLVPVSAVEACRLLSEKVELKIIPGAGHLPFISDQKQLLFLLEGFILRSGANG
ncbi:pimeloyl-[acyl-carrier protein] methyl ester esterase [Bathymodiolus japonicus methanotrophic gill symbiont]|uniref:pimeloyl-ACP methyl ester esterase BioH n=1 Tax=Bathymodiolus japonicus methanotrophic gill symbiont TaxID=113269 RepID=UPI001B785B84|nr:pimeloyl-ACP methyl ester esterase BioH [Bathymodiolus japonicus methanotrophic gill symbiont]GFO72005.1 pimeloyl-[acyl-carrier protein] methyl ester esterase [Bathymodiolus japonicus methanotrophic gill symbiont]